MDDSESESEFFDAEESITNAESPRNEANESAGELEKATQSSEEVQNDGVTAKNEKETEIGVDSELDEKKKAKTPENVECTIGEETENVPIAPPRRKKKSGAGSGGLERIEELKRSEATTTTTTLATAGKFDSKEDLTVAAVNEIPDRVVIVQKEIERPRLMSASGRPFTDKEILEQVSVKNLDTGETMSLSVAEEKIAKGVNPLSLHIMRLTSEYVSMQNLAETGGSDDEKRGGAATATDGGGKKSKEKGKARRKIKNFIAKTKDKLKQVKGEMFGDDAEPSEDESPPDTNTVRVKPSSHHKGPYAFQELQMKQNLSGEHVGAVWTMKFSSCGRLLATAGQDNVVRIFVLKEAHSYFRELRVKYGIDANKGEGETKPVQKNEAGTEACSHEDEPFEPQSFCSYHGHTSDVLDLSWSKNYFLLSSSMDKTVRLWHISRQECLCCFQHVDFVTAIAFHPRDDRYFLSGSLDGKLRLWNIPDKKVALWNEVEGISKGASNYITAANFCLSGKYAVAGTYDGRCLFYDTEHLKYHTQIHAKSTRGKNAKGRKIAGIEPMPGEDKVLITSNDSRLRLYDLKDHSLTCKYKGCTNSSSQIRASFNHDGRLIICGSEDHYSYMWKTYHEFSKFSSGLRRDRNDYYERFKVGEAVVTVSCFAPVPGLFAGRGIEEVEGEVILTADFAGNIKVFSTLHSLS
ncbi:WD repeat-containing protein 44-like isoform X1 [Oscarella lobularis]|uniref:WD repeat-containing protein 44-like isoform X1 n=1 Tax=Oscarella lobularis TaxID=121494 RepID=UPI003313D8F7